MKSPKEISVLVIDDEPELRELITMDLELHQFKTYSAQTVGEALRILSRQPIDVILSDIRMPGKTGVDMLKMVQAYNHDLPIVILMTGYADITDQEAIHLGAACVLHKPFDRKLLIDTIFQFVNKKTG